MPDPTITITFAEHERRARATARARTVWDAAIALFGAHPDWGLAECIEAAETAWADLHARCIAAEPLTDETEFAFGIGATEGARQDE